MKSIVMLKKLIATSTVLTEPLNYFFDLVEEKILFNSDGYHLIENTERHVELLTVLEAVKYGASQQLHQVVELASHTFFEVPEDHFYHGVCMTHIMSVPLMVLYCSDLQIGVVSIASERRNNILRFALTRETDLHKIH